LKELLLQQQRQQQQQQQQINSLNDKLLNSSPSTPRHSSIDGGKGELRSYDHVSLHGNTGAINILETLQSKLKQKDGEIGQLQKEIKNLERIRESMAKELVNLSNKLDTLQEQLKEFPQLQDKHNVSSMIFMTALFCL
jgi:predicted nuclease with TOPRIM domain